MRYLAFLFAGLIHLAGCGEGVSNGPVSNRGTWMLDTFTLVRAGRVGLSHGLHVWKLVFRPDGTGDRISVALCGDSAHQAGFVWEYRGGDAIAVVAGPDLDDGEEWLLTPRNTCSTPSSGQEGAVEEITIDIMQEGGLFDSWVLYRADVCLAPYHSDTCPEDFECDDCQTVWCGDPPEPCQL